MFSICVSQQGATELQIKDHGATITLRPSDPATMRAMNVDSDTGRVSFRTDGDNYFIISWNEINVTVRIGACHEASTMIVIPATIESLNSLHLALRTWQSLSYAILGAESIVWTRDPKESHKRQLHA